MSNISCCTPGPIILGGEWFLSLSDTPPGTGEIIIPDFGSGSSIENPNRVGLYIPDQDIDVSIYINLQNDNTDNRYELMGLAANGGTLTLTQNGNSVVYGFSKGAFSYDFNDYIYLNSYQDGNFRVLQYSPEEFNTNDPITVSFELMPEAGTVLFYVKGFDQENIEFNFNVSKSISTNDYWEVDFGNNNGTSGNLNNGTNFGFIISSYSNVSNYIITLYTKFPDLIDSMEIDLNNGNLLTGWDNIRAFQNLREIDVLNIALQYAPYSQGFVFTDRIVAGSSSVEYIYLENLDVMYNLDFTNYPKLNYLDINTRTSENGIDFNSIAATAKNLESLYFSSDSDVNSLDFSSLGTLPKLKNLNLNGFFFIGGVGIDFNNLTNLESLSLDSIDQVSEIDIALLTNLTQLTAIYSGNLTNIIFGENSQIAELLLFNTGIVNLDLSKLNRLQLVDIGYCSSLTTLNLSNLTNLKQIYFQNGNLTSIDFSDNVNLLSIQGFNSNLASLDLSNNKYVTNVGLSSSSLNSVIIPDSNIISNFNGDDTELIANDINYILIQLAKNPVYNGFCNLVQSISYPLSPAATTAKATLISRGWTVNTF